MIKKPIRPFDIEKLAKDVREKRGQRPMREIEAEIGIPIATLSRVERGNFPDYDNLSLLRDWLETEPGDYFIRNLPNKDDSLKTQLRGAQKMSAETAAAFMEMPLAAYEEILEQTDDVGCDQSRQHC